MKNQVIDTIYGKVRGLHGWDPRITVFKGIPYAAPPVGSLRFQAPVPHAGWEDVRDCFDYAPVSMQETPGIHPEVFWTHEMHPTGPDYEVSEDCLYLNVFTPTNRGEEKLPVLFYIHGGGFSGGYPSEIEFDWERMALKGMVVVAIQYRLGLLGFFACPELSAAFPDAPKGNYGLLDQIAALRWVKENIAAFGGDPERVTIAGQSAGAMSVQALLSCEETRGLFAGAIMESSVCADLEGTPHIAHPLAYAEELGKKYMEGAGYSDLKALMKAPAEELCAKVSEALGRGVFFQPTLDGILIKDGCFDSILKGKHHPVPCIAGYNRGETVRAKEMSAAKYGTLNGYREYAEKLGKDGAAFMKEFPVSTDEEAAALFEKDAFCGGICATRMFGLIQYEQGRKAYLYEFDGDIPGEDHIGSYHGSEMWFAYDGLGRCWRPFEGRHYDLARQITSYWTNFIKTGDPNGNDVHGNELPRWESYTEENEFVLLFKDRPEKSPEKTDELMKFQFSRRRSG